MLLAAISCTNHDSGNYCEVESDNNPLRLSFTEQWSSANSDLTRETIIMVQVKGFRLVGIGAEFQFSNYRV